MSNTFARLDELSTRISRISGRVSLLQEQLETNTAQLKAARFEQRITAAAINIVLRAGEVLQAKISNRLSSIASNAVASVFPNPYSINVEFNPTGRGNIDATILLERDGNEFRPILPSGQLVAGGGPIEITAWGLRPALWAQARPRLRPIFFLDEPFRFLERGLVEAVGEMLQTISDQIGAQIILITHLPDLAEFGNPIHIGDEK